MAEPISELYASWANETGIVLNWTAASDVTTGSQYVVYVLQNPSNPFPTWSKVSTLGSNVSFAPSSSTYTLTNPVNTYTFPQQKIEQLNLIGVVAPNSFAFSVIHIDVNGVESTPVNICVFKAPTVFRYGVPHLTNGIVVDPWNQFEVNVQDSYAEISSNVAMYMGTERGQRTAVPSFGIMDLPFSDINTSQIQKELFKWEPRATVSVTVKYDDKNQAVLNVNVQTNSNGE
jgi:hypothetical protein